MAHDRRRRGFERAGQFSPERLSFSATRLRDLQLALAWARVAGATLATRAPLRGFRRGVLEVEVPDARWADTLRDLLPGLAGRIAATHPELGIRRCRVILAGQAPSPSAEAVPVVVAAAGRPAAARDVRTQESPARTAPSAGSPLERLRALGERYLQRGSELQRDQKP